MRIPNMTYHTHFDSDIVEIKYFQAFDAVDNSSLPHNLI